VIGSAAGGVAGRPRDLERTPASPRDLPSSAALPEDLARDLDRRLGRAQADWRSLAAAAAVVREGTLVWSAGVGSVEAASSRVPDAGTQFRIGSITKTFTAVLVMQCRDEGLLDLDDRLERFIPGTAHGALTVRRMLAHRSGLQREPVGEIWDRPQGPPAAELLAGLADAEAVLPPARLWHYSNLAYALLGDVVARLRGAPWDEAVRSRVLEPLGLARTSLRRQEPHAAGYLTDPYADRVHPEPEFPGNAFAPAGELWSTPADLARWGAFLADPAGVDPDAEVLAPATVDEMCHPQVMYDLDAWTLGWGLGLMLHRRGDRILVGHDGAMPGFLAGLAVRRPERVSAVCFASATSGADPGGLAIDLALAVVDGCPPAPQVWRPGPDPEPGVEDLLGLWWSEGSPFTFSWTGGRLTARRNDLPATRPPAVFVAEGPDSWRVVSGREQGEVLHVERGPDRAVRRMVWATYPFTRAPRTFGSA
jgi:CubicO group peptidase (beta-lactamase class C family)